MLIDRLHYEVRLLGRWAILTPVLILLASALLTIVLHLNHTKTVTLFTACLEMFLPLIAGVCAIMLSGHDQALELQLTLPQRYRRTILCRIAIITIWIALVALSATLILHWSKLAKTVPITSADSWTPTLQWIAGQLIWLASLLWFTGTGLFLTLLTRSRTASSALLGGIWVAENIMYGLLISTGWLHPIFLFATTLTPIPMLNTFWLTNRLALTGTGIVLLTISWWQLQHAENLLTHIQDTE